MPELNNSEKVMFDEERLDALNQALDAVLQFAGDYRAPVLNRIAERWATWGDLIITISVLPLPPETTKGGVLQDTLDQLLAEGLICVSAADRARKYILTENGRQFFLSK